MSKAPNKHSSHPDYNDKNAFMAWMRSHVNKENIGRKPNKPIDDFELENAVRAKGLRPIKKWKNEHIKCVTITEKEPYPDKDVCKVYIVGFLTDSNRFSFDYYRDNPNNDKRIVNPGLFRLERAYNLFCNKRIDTETVMIACVENYSDRDFFPLVLNFVSRLTGSLFYKVTVPDIVFALDNELNIFRRQDKSKRKSAYFRKLSRAYLFVKFNEEYAFVADSGFCPWITGLEKMRNERLRLKARHGIMISEMAMLVGMMRGYHKMQERLKDGGDSK